MSKRRAYLEPAALEALLDDACKKIVQHLRGTRVGAAILLGKRKQFPLKTFIKGVLHGLPHAGENVPFKFLQEYARRHAQQTDKADDRRLYKAVEKGCIVVRTQVQLVRPDRLRKTKTKDVVPIDMRLILNPA